jgi:hypothetical protein
MFRAGLEAVVLEKVIRDPFALALDGPPLWHLLAGAEGRN